MVLVLYGMKRLFTVFGIIACFALASCDDSDFNLVIPSPPSGLPGDDEDGDDEGSGVVEPSSPDWCGLADSCTFVLIENFMNKQKGTFWKSPQNVEGGSGNIYWQQAHAMDVVIYSYERIADEDPGLASIYKDYFSLWYDNDANNYNNSKESEGDYGGFFNQYTDDMCWICLTLIHMSDAVGDEKYAETAKEVYDRYIITRLIEDETGSALPWTNIEGKQGKNACTNAPACLVASKLYLRYEEEKYLADAVKLYDYMSANIVKPDGRVGEPPLTYTQGTFGEACRYLWHITGEDKYLTDATSVLMCGMSSPRCTKDGLLRSEGKSMDQSIFKAVMIPYVVNYILDKDIVAPEKGQLRELLLTNGDALSENLERSLYPQMYANYYWGTPFTDSVASMGAQTSGASLMEGIARMILSE